MATAVISKRELIMAEVMRRLKLAYPLAGVERGFTKTDVTKFNQFFVFDLPEAIEQDERPGRRGQYHCSFPVSISYFLQTHVSQMYAEGNRHLEQIRLALELDEFFKDEHGTILATDYTYDEGALIWYEEGILDVELMFIFQYTKSAGWLKNSTGPLRS